MLPFCPIAIAVLAVMLVLGVVADSAQARTRRAPKLDADKVLADARVLQRAGDREQAEAMVDRVLAADKRNVDALLQKGTLSLQRGDDVAAEKYYRDVIARAPKYTDAYLGLSNVYLRRREVDNAAIVLGWVPVDAIRGPEYLAQQGRIERARGRFLKARSLFNQARQEQPDNTDYVEASRDTPVIFNTLAVESEQFKRTGSSTVVSNTFTARPDRRVAVDFIAEQWIRTYGRPDPQRFGGGLSLSPVEWFTIRGQALESTDEQEVPSRYDLDVDVRILPNPGTHLLAGVTRYDSSPVDTNAQNLGLRQYLTDKIAVQVQRYWAKDTGNDAVGAKTDVIRVIYENPGVRNLSLGYASGNEAYRVDNVGVLPGRDYDFESVFVSAKQWVGRNWGVLGGFAISNRSNGNDSNTYSAGVFVEF
jgi:YaiO family outer membrane protein